MTEQQIMKLINEKELSAQHITYDALVRQYVMHLASIAPSISHRDFVGLLAVTALLYHKSKPGANGVGVLGAEQHAE